MVLTILYNTINYLVYKYIIQYKSYLIYSSFFLSGKVEIIGETINEGSYKSYLDVGKYCTAILFSGFESTRYITIKNNHSNGFITK